MAKQRLTRVAGDLVVESKTLWYEFSQFCKVAERLRTDNYDRSDNTVHNALVESFAIHYRQLCYFFFPHDNGFPDLRGDDLGAVEYVPGWATVCPALAKILSDAKEPADKHVAHMTSLRRDLNFVSGKEHPWLIDEIERELLVVLGVFVREAPISLFDTVALAELRKLTGTPTSTTGTSASTATDSGLVAVLGGGRTVTNTRSPPNSQAGFQAKTEVRTIAPEPGDKSHGTTE